MIYSSVTASRYRSRVPSVQCATRFETIARTSSNGILAEFSRSLILFLLAWLRACLNLRGGEQSCEGTAIDSRQSWNPRGGHKIRIVGPSRLMKHSTSCGTVPERRPIPARSSVKIARSITKRTNRPRGEKTSTGPTNGGPGYTPGLDSS